MKNISMEFLEDEYGRQQVIDLMNDIERKSQTDEKYRELSTRIAQVFLYVSEIGVPPKDLRTMYAQSLDGFTITLVDIVKELTGYKPLLELRINWYAVGAFRAIFFYEEDNRGNQVIYFTKAVIKDSTHSEEFEDIAAKSQTMRIDFYSKE